MQSETTKIVLLKEKIKEVLLLDGVKEEISQVKIDDAGLKGENFSSETKCATITFCDPALKPLNLFLKTEPENKSHSEFLEVTKLFEKEALFFTKYIPAVRKFLASKGQSQLLDIYPKCYYADTKLTIFENLVLERGFELIDKTEKQDFEIASLALVSLAKHHAISHAFIKELDGIEKLIKNFPKIEFEAFEKASVGWDDLVENTIKTCILILTNSSAEGKEEAISMLTTKLGIAWNYAMEKMKHDPNDPLLLLNHGDYWNNNMLFKRNKEKNRCDDHIIIDLQAVRIDSPGADLGYFLFSSVKPDVRQTRLEELLTVYLNKLNETTEKLGCSMNLAYEELFQNFRKRLDFGFWIFGIWVATRASYAVLKDFDIASLQPSEWAKVLDDLVLNWVNTHPEECEVEARDIVKLMKEYKSLSLEVHLLPSLTLNC